MPEKTVVFEPFGAKHVQDAIHCYAHCMATNNPILTALSITKQQFMPYATKTVSRMVDQPCCFVAIEKHMNGPEKMIGVYLTSGAEDYMEHRREYHEQCARNKNDIPRNVRIREAFMWEAEERIQKEYGHVPRGLLIRGFVGVMLPEYAGNGIFSRMHARSSAQWVARGYVAMAGIPTSEVLIQRLFGTRNKGHNTQLISVFYYDDFLYEGQQTPLHGKSPGYTVCGIDFLDGATVGQGAGKDIVPKYTKPVHGLPDNFKARV
eukprot:319381_1